MTASGDTIVWIGGATKVSGPVWLVDARTRRPGFVDSPTVRWEATLAR